jgi:hypothetical protein
MRPDKNQEQKEISMNRKSVSPFKVFSIVVGLLVALSVAPLLQSPLEASSALGSSDPTASLPVDPTIVYETVFNGAWLDSGQDIAVDAAGNAYILAYAYDNNNDIYVIKLSPEGELVWSTFIQGNALDVAGGIAVGPGGDAYIIGRTTSSDFPLVNPLQGQLNGQSDAFVARLSAQDGSFVFSTYFGGNRAERAYDIALNDAGEIYIVGATKSTDFPTVDPIQDALNTNECFCFDAFISKLSADGSTLLYSTYLGGSFDDEGFGIGLDGNGNIYLAGETNSADFPTAAPLQPNFGGGFRDVFVTQISADGSALAYSSFLGGEDWDRAGRIAVDSSGNLYVAGTTRSVGFPTTAGAYQEEFAGGINTCGQPPYDPIRNCDDVFVSKVLPDGSALAYSTYLGGNNDEEGRGVALNSSGEAYVIGYTKSPDFPPEGGIEGADIYVSKFSTDGSNLVYTLIIDSPSPTAGHGIAVDGVDSIYITGAVNVPADLFAAKIIESPPKGWIGPPPVPVPVQNIPSIEE